MTKPIYVIENDRIICYETGTKHRIALTTPDGYVNTYCDEWYAPIPHTKTYQRHYTPERVEKFSGMCPTCAIALRVTTQTLTLPGITQELSWRSRDLYLDNKSLPDNNARYINREYHRLLDELPQEVQNLLKAHEIIERELAKGLRCPVCLSYDNPHCAEDC